jgi:hypothetical protein
MEDESKGRRSTEMWREREKKRTQRREKDGKERNQEERVVVGRKA